MLQRFRVSTANIFAPLEIRFFQHNFSPQLFRFHSVSEIHALFNGEKMCISFENLEMFTMNDSNYTSRFHYSRAQSSCSTHCAHSALPPMSRATSSERSLIGIVDRVARADTLDIVEQAARCDAVGCSAGSAATVAPASALGFCARKRCSLSIALRWYVTFEA